MKTPLWFIRLQISYKRWKYARLRRAIFRQRMKAEPSRACLGCGVNRLYPPKTLCWECVERIEIHRLNSIGQD